jgi:hypothetical protein
MVYSLKAKTVESKQQKNGVFCALCATGYTCNTGIHHAIAKKQQHCNRGKVFSMQFVPRFISRTN